MSRLAIYFIQAFLGVKAKNVTIRMFKNKYYNEKVLQLMPLDEVLESYVGTKIIDFATIDLEGGEIPILNAFENRWTSDKNGSHILSGQSVMYTDN